MLLRCLQNLLCGVLILHGASIRAQLSAPVSVPSTTTILVVGDSLSAEYGLKRGSGWVTVLADQLQAAFPQLVWHNVSISGDTTSGGVTRLPRALAQYQPQIVILELGANDALRGLSLAATRANLAHMVQLAQRAGAHVVLVGMQIPPNYGKSYTTAFQALFSTLAQEHGAALVPFLLEGIANDRSQFQADGIHPTEAAQPQLAANVAAVLRPLLHQITP